MESGLVIVERMATKKGESAPKTTTINVRKFPVDLVKKLRALKEERGINIYQYIRDAVREKMKRDAWQKEE